MDVTDQLAIFLRMVLAAGLGGFIGIERELRGYPAGVRTMALVALGASLFTEISIVTSGEDRIAAGIVTGVGFLGAGVIFREGYTIKGITTAATVWSAAAIGMAVGRHLYWAAVLGSVLIFLLLEARPVVKAIDDFLQRHVPLLIEHEPEEEPKRNHNDGR
ncbi:MAG: MgtC/SapB family protein [Dehalococcoidia bacterium]|jgi:putative Mg2+ transporter-C (MgtC) family protein